MSDISEKLAVMRGGGHHVPAGLGEILLDLEARIAALEPKAKPKEPEPRKGTDDGDGI